MKMPKNTAQNPPVIKGGKSFWTRAAARMETIPAAKNTRNSGRVNGSFLALNQMKTIMTGRAAVIIKSRSIPIPLMPSLPLFGSASGFYRIFGRQRINWNQPFFYSPFVNYSL
jgi:hypothetical protein